MKNKKDNARIITIIFEFFSLAIIATATIGYGFQENSSIQVGILVIVLVAIGLTFIIESWLDTIEQYLFDIKQSLDDAYDIKQVSELRSTMDRRHLEKLSAEIKKILEEKTDEESRN